MATATTGPSTWLPIVFPPTETTNVATSPNTADSSANEVDFRPSTEFLPIVFPPKTAEITASPVARAELDEKKVQEADEVWNILMI
ncbi:unnamed protein product [Caenorhabditis nigoni]